MTRRRHFVTVAFLVLLGTSAARAAPPPRLPDVSGLLPLLSGGSADALAGAMRGFLVRGLPNPVYESWPGWGATKTGKISGKPKKNGHWRHIVVTVLTPGDTLVFDIRNLQQPEPGRIVFAVALSFDARVDYEVQNWQLGMRMSSNSVRARFRARATLNCEVTYRLEPGALLPDAVFRFRIAQADVRYDNFVTEHIAGVGGDAAEIIGDAVKSGLKQFHPSLERDLLAKMNAQIEKAADTKEVRVSVYDLLKKKGWLNGPPAAPVPIPPTAPASPKLSPPLPPDPGWQPVDPPK